jgi:hypothetical protein
MILFGDNNFAPMPCFTANMILFVDDVALTSYHSFLKHDCTFKESLHSIFPIWSSQIRNQLHPWWRSETCLDSCEMNGWLRRSLLDHRGDEPGWTFVWFDPQACNLNGPPYQPSLTPTPTPTPLHPSSLYLKRSPPLLRQTLNNTFERPNWQSNSRY